MLEKFTSLCDARQKVIVSKDAGSSKLHRARNVDGNLVRHYRIDGDVITSKDVQKCDFLLLNDDKKNAYLIELKQDLNGYQKHFRIVYSSNTHAIRSSEYVKFRMDKKGNVKASTDLLDEAI